MLKIVPGCFVPELIREGIQISCAVQLSAWNERRREHAC